MWHDPILNQHNIIVNCLIPNSILIHTVRMRSKLNILGLGNQDESEGENVRHKYSEK